jgi:hypothetical protein
MARLEVVAIEFSGPRFKAEVLQALQSAVDSGAIQIIDMTLIRKDASGRVTSYELVELEEPELALFDVVGETRGLLSVADIAKVGRSIALNSSAAIIVFDHAWTAELERAILDAKGRVIVHELVPEDVADAALADPHTRPEHRSEGAR